MTPTFIITIYLVVAYFTSIAVAKWAHEGCYVGLDDIFWDIVAGLLWPLTGLATITYWLYKL